MYEIEIKREKGRSPRASREKEKLRSEGVYGKEPRRKKRKASGPVSGVKGVIAFISVIVFSTALSTVAMHATNGVPLSETLLGSAVQTGEQGPCPQGMVFVDSGSGGFCIDEFENAPSSACPYATPSGSHDTEETIETAECGVVSHAEREPWRHVARHQAERLCSSAGKRLPTPEEWYLAALGTPSHTNENEAPVCNLDGSEPLTGSELPDCRSSVGAISMTGNVWEWVSGDVVSGEWEGRTLPESGYVSSVDSAGMPIETAREPQRSYGNAYARTKKDESVYGILRGGWWGSDTEGGIYAANAAVEPSFSGRAVGFRCARSL